MGYDLKPIKPTDNFPQDEDGAEWKRYGFMTWIHLDLFIREFKLRPLPQTNDGYLITEKKCKKIANILCNNKQKLEDLGMDWLQDDADWWDNCGGCRVY